jgi:acyl transferase domain-containing protein
MESPVLFDSALRSALQDVNEDLILIEIGPHPALAGPMRQILGDLSREAVQISTLSRGKGCHESILHLAGKLYQQNVPIDYLVVCAPGHFVEDLPSYSWDQMTTHWAEPRVAREWRFRQYPPHELLGSRVFQSAGEPCWRVLLDLEDVSWLQGHQVSDKVVFPCSAYICMVGEALRQLDGEMTFSLRNVRLTSARVLEAGKPTEFLTNMSPMMRDSTEYSSWYSFTISSFDGSKWTRNCSGEATSSVTKSSFTGSTILPHFQFPRKVVEDRWYKTLSTIGFNYSGMFKGLQSVSADTTTDTAIAMVPVRAEVPASGSTYSLHPATIDICFQLLTVAVSRGVGRKMSTLAVPTFIEELSIAACPSELSVLANATALERGSFTGNLTAESSEKQFLQVKGFKASALTTGAVPESKPIYSHLEWSPSSDFARLHKHIRPQQGLSDVLPLLEELIILCAFDHQDRIKLDASSPKYLADFLNWMGIHTERYLSGTNIFVPKTLHLENLETPSRLARIEKIVTELSESQWSMMSTAIIRLFRAAPEIFSGEIHPLSLLMEDDVLTRVYNAGTTLDYFEAFHMIGNTNPRLKVLEVGAGTGGTTMKVLQALKSSYDERLYGSYVYTDVSSGFITAARQRFADFENMVFTVLDITKCPIEQGFQPATYDLIICSNVRSRIGTTDIS